MHQEHWSPSHGLIILLGVLFGSLLLGLPVAEAAVFSSVDPSGISAGTFYHGAVIHVRGTVSQDSQLVVRVEGAAEHHVFNRRGKIGGVIWGGVEHVTFKHAPSFYAVYSSGALAAIAPPALRSRLRLEYDAIESAMDVQGTKVNRQVMTKHFVRFKESEGLYRIVPGGVHLGDPEGGNRAFAVSVPVPSSAPPGDLRVFVFEIAGGKVLHEDTAVVKVERVGLPAYLFRLAHENGVLFGFLALFVTITTGVIVDFVGRKGASRNRGPILDVEADLRRLFVEGLFNLRARPRSPEAVERLRGKYGLFRNLLTLNNELLELLAELEEESSWSSLRNPRVRMGIRALFDGTADMVEVLNQLTGNRYFDLRNVVAGLRSDVLSLTERTSAQEGGKLTLRLAEVNSRTADQVGGKAINLARVEGDLKLSVPSFFVVTTEAYRQFLDADGLAGKLRTVLAPARLDASDDFRRRCGLAQTLIREATIPQAVRDAIRDSYATLGVAPGVGVAVRSSAAGEDGDLSFAGQFETVINVPESEVAEAWKRVVESRFSPRAVFYRRAAGLAEVDNPMAVLVQQMVRARASGVLFTRRPQEPKAAQLLIAAVRGLGPEVSTGIAKADEFVVSRSGSPRIVERRIQEKPVRLICADGGGLTRLPETADQRMTAAITDDEVLRLAAVALETERYFRRPQDIEWAIDEDGRLFVLQARPLATDKSAAALGGAAPRGASLLLHGGQPVWTGRAVGAVHVATNTEEEDRVPQGAILVVPQLLPDCVRLLPRVCAIIVEHGMVTGHAASILREFRIPSLFGVDGAVHRLVTGQIVSLDVAACSVYDGELWPRLRGHLPVRLLGRRTTGLPEVLAGKLTKLSGMSFMGTWACQSLHDVIRFAHEMAIQSMFDIGDRLLQSPIGGVAQLQSEGSMFVHIVDLGGGLRTEAATKRTVALEDVFSIPFRALWRGLSDPRIEHRVAPPLQSFSAALGTTLSDKGSREMGSPNYACITESYLNLNSRQAYHFAIVDALLSANQTNNHISVRIKGGGGAPWQRSLRAEFVGEVLRMYHFTVDITGDLVNGWIRGVDLTTGEHELAAVGRLLSFSSLLDLWMTGEDQVKRYVREFVEVEAKEVSEHGREEPHKG